MTCIRRLIFSSNADEIVRYFTPMYMNITRMYDDLRTATSHGKLRDVLKIEEKLKLLR
jgi:hypothetical protein